MTKVDLPPGIVIVKVPSALVSAATVVPFTVTVANPTGELSLAFVTFPVTVF
jgi:hypothetical protein